MLVDSSDKIGMSGKLASSLAVINVSAAQSASVNGELSALVVTFTGELPLYTLRISLPASTAIFSITNGSIVVITVAVPITAPVGTSVNAPVDFD
tara:strand:- start:426 stop:710 length:285 start_codon:yes stop_codon:yes gene_type:complete